MTAPASTTHVEVSSRRFAIPADCPCCGATPDTEIAVPLSRTARARATTDSARAIDFPYCRPCVDHVARWESAGVLSAGLSILGVLLGLVLAATVGLAAGLGAGVGAIAIALLLSTSRRTTARHAMRESCSSPGKAIEYLGWSGTSSAFRFESMPFAAKFAEQNASLVVEDPKLRKLLERYKLARIAVPTPAAPISTIPPPLDAGEWIARIAKLPGRVARRTELVRALEVVREPREREQMIRAVSAIEIAALLAPLDKLADASAKQRVLRAVLEQVRRDNIPAELQREVLRDLEERLGQLR
jgi:hypothetical protein